MRIDGSLISGVLKDALTSMRVSLTCGRMWRTLPASHVALVGACTCAGCASNSADMPRPKATADDDFKNSRRSITPSRQRSPWQSPFVRLTQPVLASQVVTSQLALPGIAGTAAIRAAPRLRLAFFARVSAVLRLAVTLHFSPPLLSFPAASAPVLNRGRTEAWPCPNAKSLIRKYRRASFKRMKWPCVMIHKKT